ncbi:hypothetical protein HK100_004383, partial [Physocladia obscura]
MNNRARRTPIKQRQPAVRAAAVVTARATNATASSSPSSSRFSGTYPVSWDSPSLSLLMSGGNMFGHEQTSPGQKQPQSDSGPTSATTPSTTWRETLKAKCMQRIKDSRSALYARNRRFRQTQTNSFSDKNNDTNFMDVSDSEDAPYPPSSDGHPASADTEAASDSDKSDYSYFIQPMHRLLPTTPTKQLSTALPSFTSPSYIKNTSHNRNSSNHDTSSSLTRLLRKEYSTLSSSSLTTTSLSSASGANRLPPDIDPDFLADLEREISVELRALGYYDSNNEAEAAEEYEQYEAALLERDISIHNNSSNGKIYHNGNASGDDFEMPTADCTSTNSLFSMQQQQQPTTASIFCPVCIQNDALETTETHGGVVWEDQGRGTFGCTQCGLAVVSGVSFSAWIEGLHAVARGHAAEHCGGGGESKVVFVDQPAVG